METVQLLNITETAAKKIKEHLKTSKMETGALRVFIKGGGCSGYSYGLTLEDKPSEDDNIIDSKGVKVVVDKASADKLKGVTIDYLESLEESGFKINNPAATSSCGCGKSFGTGGC